MKTLSILVLLLVLGACRNEEGIWDKLSAAEKAALEQRASLKCIGDEQRDIDDIIETSNDNLEDAERLDTYEISTNASPAVVNQIHVWKKTATYVIFLYRQSDSNGDVSKYIKVPLAQNIEQYRDLQRKRCATLLTTASVTNKYKSASLSNSTFIGNYEEGRVIVDDDNYSIQTQTFTYNKEFPAVFGILQKTRVKKTYKEDNDVLGTTDTFKWTIKRVADVSSLYTAWDHSSYTNPKFCMARFTSAVVVPPTSDIFYPIPISDTALLCDADITKVDADGNGTSDFLLSDVVYP